MREVLERAANAMLKSGKGESIYFVIEAMTAEFPEYKFMSDGSDKIIVLEL